MCCTLDSEDFTSVFPKLVLSGIATSGVVLSTLRYAAGYDYRLFVLSDVCADQDAEVHRVPTEKVCQVGLLTM